MAVGFTKGSQKPEQIELGADHQSSGKTICTLLIIPLKKNPLLECLSRQIEPVACAFPSDVAGDVSGAQEIQESPPSVGKIGAR